MAFALSNQTSRTPGTECAARLAQSHHGLPVGAGRSIRRKDRRSSGRRTQNNLGAALSNKRSEPGTQALRYWPSPSVAYRLALEVRNEKRPARLGGDPEQLGPCAR